MGKFKLPCIISFWIFCSVEGQRLKISTKFITCNGSLIFSWNKISNERFDVFISKDSEQLSGAQEVFDGQYIVQDVIQYKSVTIKVWDFNTRKYYNETYEVIVTESKEGESKNISWTAEYFPRSDTYFIFHEYNGSVSTIIKIANAVPPPNKKYVYHTRPFNSTNILFEVRNITVEDAGYYIGGYSEADALKEQGVFLIVYGKPMTPFISGNLNVTVRYSAVLKCKSKSTSAPSYYNKFPPLSYSWFVNNTRLKREVRETYSFTVTKDVKYNRYSCQAKETLESERSEEIRINPLYGPENIKITPQPPVDGLNINDGETFGPYTCSADCNPPCNVQWKYKHPKGGFRDATPIGTFSVIVPEQTANKTSMALIRCVVNGTEGKNASSIKLNIQYLSDPKVYINGKLQNTLTINESNSLLLSCLVDGNPPPEVILKKLSGNMIIKKHNLSREARCSDTSTYSCEGKLPGFGSKNQTFKISVLCDPRFDDSRLLKPSYGSMSGPDVTVAVNLPVVANPLSSTMSSSEFIWTGPAESIRSGPAFEPISIKVSQRDNVVYKHWINSTIPVPDPRFFGNYSLMYKGKVIADITIKAEDKPQQPLNFTGYSYAVGFINLTWISNFNGGPEQFYILYRKEGTSWTFIKNLTDPGEGKMGYHDLGPLTPGQEYWYQLESCNRINCSLSPVEVKVRVKAPPISSTSLFGDNTMLILVGASVAGFLLVVVLTGAVMMYCKTTKKSVPKKRDREERLSGCKQIQSTVQDSTPADAVVYAAVDKSVLMKNRQQADLVENDVIKDQNDDNDTMYSEVIKHPKKQKQTDEKKKKNGGEGFQGKNEEAGASTSNDNSRSTNQDGLVYIDVEFARKPLRSDTKGRPVIHGEDEKTEYTFVDFTQKAPPVQETKENVK